MQLLGDLHTGQIGIGSGNGEQLHRLAGRFRQVHYLGEYLGLIVCEDLLRLQIEFAGTGRIYQPHRQHDDVQLVLCRRLQGLRPGADGHCLVTVGTQVDLHGAGQLGFV